MASIEAAIEAERNEDLERELLAEHGERWAGPLGRLASGYAFHRGFLSELTLAAESFLEFGDAITGMAPILRVKLEDVAPVAEAIFTSPILAGIPALDLALLASRNALYAFRIAPSGITPWSG